MIGVINGTRNRHQNPMLGIPCNPDLGYLPRVLDATLKTGEQSSTLPPGWLCVWSQHVMVRFNDKGLWL